jgi:hypothetical protein
MHDTGIKQNKKCGVCKEAKPLGDFYKCKSRKDGLTRLCKECSKERAKKYYNPERVKEQAKRWIKDNPEKHADSVKKWDKANRGRVIENLRKNREADPEKEMWRAARDRAKRQGLPFDIRPLDIFIPKECPALLIPLFKGKGRNGPNSPSLDKIIPELGYVKGNIRVISQLANMMKQNATLEQCVLLGQYAARLLATRNSIHVAA